MKGALVQRELAAKPSEDCHNMFYEYERNNPSVKTNVLTPPLTQGRLDVIKPMCDNEPKDTEKNRALRLVKV